MKNTILWFEKLSNCGLIWWTTKIGQEALYPILETLYFSFLKQWLRIWIFHTSPTYKFKLSKVLALLKKRNFQLKRRIKCNWESKSPKLFSSHLKPWECPTLRNSGTCIVWHWRLKGFWMGLKTLTTFQGLLNFMGKYWRGFECFRSLFP